MYLQIAALARTPELDIASFTPDREAAAAPAAVAMMSRGEAEDGRRGGDLARAPRRGSALTLEEG